MQKKTLRLSLIGLIILLVLGLGIYLKFQSQTPNEIDPNSNTSSETEDNEEALLHKEEGEVFYTIPNKEETNVEEDVHIPSGTKIRTGEGVAVVVFLDDSIMTIDAQTEVEITYDKQNVSVFQTIGNTWHRVTSLISSKNSYEVDTPSALATVRGTIFGVEVNEDGESDVMVDESLVDIFQHTPTGPKFILQLQTKQGITIGEKEAKPEDVRKLIKGELDKDWLRRNKRLDNRWLKLKARDIPPAEMIKLVNPNGELQALRKILGDPLNPELIDKQNLNLENKCDPVNDPKCPGYAEACDAETDPLCPGYVAPCDAETNPECPGFAEACDPVNNKLCPGFAKACDPVNNPDCPNFDQYCETTNPLCPSYLNPNETCVPECRTGYTCNTSGTSPFCEYIRTSNGTTTTLTCSDLNCNETNGYFCNDSEATPYCELDTSTCYPACDSSAGEYCNLSGTTPTCMTEDTSCVTAGCPAGYTCQIDSISPSCVLEDTSCLTTGCLDGYYCNTDGAEPFCLPTSTSCLITDCAAGFYCDTLTEACEPIATTTCDPACGTGFYCDTASVDPMCIPIYVPLSCEPACGAGFYCDTSTGDPYCATDLTLTCDPPCNTGEYCDTSGTTPMCLLY